MDAFVTLTRQETFNPRNQLTNAPFRQGAQKYDSNGNLTNGTSTAYTYDDENRLVRRVYNVGSAGKRMTIKNIWNTRDGL
jgi:hypothetical protein